MPPTPAPLEDARAPFDKRFDRSFLRVYAYLLPRVPDHATAQRLTREVLTASLAEVLDYDEPELDLVLLRAVKRQLAAEASRGGSSNAGT
jgi:hypothetical protein